MKFWIGSNDVGPHGYSGLSIIEAATLNEAKRFAERKFGHLQVDPRRMDRTLRLAVVPMDDIRSVPGGTSQSGLSPEKRYIVECESMTAKDLILVVVGYDEQNMRRFDLTHVNAAECVLVINYHQSPLSAIGNSYLMAWSLSGDLTRERPIFGLCHADTTFGPGALDVLAKTAGDGAVCGIVGMNPKLKEGDPGANPNGAKDQRWGEVWSHMNPGPVDTLDSASVFFSRSSGLRFDSVNFDGFHCHVEDLCLQAQIKGMPVGVPGCQASHGGNPNFQDWNDSWHGDYRVYKHRLLEKWKGVRFGTT